MKCGTSVCSAKAAIAFTPKIVNGSAHHRRPRTSIIQNRNPSNAIASPAVKTTYEGDHKFLLIGISHQFNSHPSTVTGTETASIPAHFSSADRPLISHSPTRMPSSDVAMDGMVERIPSLSGYGGYVCFCTQVI